MAVKTRELEDAKRQTLSRKWYQVTRLCRQAAEAARDQDPVKVRRLLVRIERYTAEAERLARTHGDVVHGAVIEGRVIQGSVLKELS